MNCVSYLTHIAEYVIINISGQGLPAELGKYIWLSKANTSQEAPNSIRGSSSRYVYENLKNFDSISSKHIHLKQFLNVGDSCDDENSYSVTTSFVVGYDGIIRLALLNCKFYDGLYVWEVFSISNKNIVCYEGYYFGLDDTLKIDPMSEDDLRLVAFAIDDIKSILKLK